MKIQIIKRHDGWMVVSNASNAVVEFHGVDRLFMFKNTSLHRGMGYSDYFFFLLEEGSARFETKQEAEVAVATYVLQTS